MSPPPSEPGSYTENMFTLSHVVKPAGMDTLLRRRFYHLPDRKFFVFTITQGVNSLTISIVREFTLLIYHLEIIYHAVYPHQGGTFYYFWDSKPDG